MKRPLISFIFLALLILAACQTEDDSADPGPSLPPPPTRTAAPSNTPPPRATLPPTWTALPAGAQVTAAPSQSPSPTATRDPQLIGSPLPPTWTLAPSPTRRVGGSTNLQGEGPFVFGSPIPPTLTPEFIEDICFNFAGDEALNSLTEQAFAGEAATIYWLPLGEGYTYRVRLYHQNGFLVTDTLTDAAQYTFEGDILNSENALYGWEVQPIFNFQVVCFPITGEMYVSPPRTD